MLINKAAVRAKDNRLWRGAGGEGRNRAGEPQENRDMTLDIEGRRKRINRTFGNITFAIVLIAGLYIFATGSETLPENTRYLILAAVALYAAIRLGSRFLRHKKHGPKRR